MKSVIEDINPVKKKIRIEVPPDDVVKETDKAFQSIAKKAKIPGFRPGKAPRAVLERHYGDDVKSDVINRLVPTAYFTAVRDHKLRPVEVPEIGEISLVKGEPFIFSATVEVRPEISLGPYDGIEVNDLALSVNDDEVEQTIKRLMEMYAHLEVVEGRPVEKDDAAIVDFEGFREGTPIENAKASNHMLTLGAGNLIPGLEDQIIGMSTGETKEIKVVFPEDYSNKGLAGKDAMFRVTLKEIKKRALPELNGEFAKDVGGHNSVEELRAGIREDIEIRKRNDLVLAQKAQLMTKLVEMHSFDIPPSMVERELEDMAKDHTMRMARQGTDIESFDEAGFREQNRPMAEHRIKGMLILDSISEQEKIEATEEDVNARFEEMARHSGRPVETIRKNYESREGMLDHLRSGIVQEKTLSLLLSRAKKVYN